MSISYEEALATLQAMFGEPWNRELLDAVLRHQQGHMENTVDLILRHSDKDPHILVQKLKAGEDLNEEIISMDEQLARQLQESQTTRANGSSANKKTRGLPVNLPADFLRIPGASSAGVAASSTSTSQMQSDEALARMLQDEMFEHQVSQNPQLSHLARGRSAATFPTGRSSAGGPQRDPNQPNIMEKINELGDNARKHLQVLAAQFNSKINQNNNMSGPSDSTSAPSERRGLLDDGDDDAMELSSRRG